MTTHLDIEATMLRQDVRNLRWQLADLRAKRKLDLDLAHVRSAGMGAEIETLKSRLRRPALEKVRDRLLMRQRPPARRKLQIILDQFIDDLTASL